MKKILSNSVIKLLSLLLLLSINTIGFAANNLNNVCANRLFNSTAPQVNLGNYWDSNKSGHGWNISKSGSGSSYNLAVTWFTYDQYGRPRWYLGVLNQTSDFENGIEYQVPLSRVEKINGVQTTTEIGLLKLMFAPDGDSRFVAMDWFLDSSEGASADIGAVDKTGLQC